MLCAAAGRGRCVWSEEVLEHGKHGAHARARAHARVRTRAHAHARSRIDADRLLPRRQVNLASRLESLGKHYGASILISGQLHDAVADAFLARPVDRVVAYGRRAATEASTGVRRAACGAALSAATDASRCLQSTS